jgi:hypothetical protein
MEKPIIAKGVKMIPQVTVETIETVQELSYRDHATYANDLADKFEELQPAYMDMATEAIDNVVVNCGGELSDDAKVLMQENMENVVIYLLHCMYAQEEINSMLDDLE